MTSKSSSWRLAITVSVCAGVLGLTAPKPITASSVLLVPEAYPTIQAAIDAAAAGDTVRVGPGTYNERIDFLGKTIVVESTGGAVETIIEPNGAVGAIVTMSLSGTQSPERKTRRRGGDAGSVLSSLLSKYPVHCCRLAGAESQNVIGSRRRMLSTMYGGRRLTSS